MTRPQTRFNAGSLLKLMEDYAIGTKATRTDIIDTLYKREYIQGKDIKITELGLTIIEALEEIVPEILSVDLTKQLEKNIALIQTGEIDANKVVEEALEILRPILEKFKDKEASIGKMIYHSLHRKKECSTLGRCPSCKTGELKVLNNKKTGKRFVGCTNYFEGKCNQSYPLPQQGYIKPTANICPNCGAPIIRILRENRKPWTLCINVECPGMKEAKVIG
jgi:DNA topoisomerase-1